jgi:hypothetical protein
MSLIQFVNVFLLHSWLAATPPFTPVQNANLLVAISSCAKSEPISDLAKTCSKPLMASTDRQHAASSD